MTQQQQAASKPVISSNTLTEEVIQQTIAALTKAMETDQLFLNTELNVSILSKHPSNTR